MQLPSHGMEKARGIGAHTASAHIARGGRASPAHCSARPPPRQQLWGAGDSLQRLEVHTHEQRGMVRRKAKRMQSSKRRPVRRAAPSYK